MSEVVN